QQMPLLGAYPGLPIAPVGTPEGFVFPGCSAWGALCDVLDLLGCDVSADLTAAAPYGIVSGGAADAAFTAKQTQYAALLQDDYEYIDTGSARVPKQVTVFFHRRNEVYGTEETIRRDGLQWQSTPLYSLTVAAPAQFANAAGTHYVWS